MSAVKIGASRQVIIPKKVYEELGSRLGTKKQDREITDLFAALAAGLLLIGSVTSAFVLRGVW